MNEALQLVGRHKPQATFKITPVLGICPNIARYFYELGHAKFKLANREKCRVKYLFFQEKSPYAHGSDMLLDLAPCIGST